VGQVDGSGGDRQASLPQNCSIVFDRALRNFTGERCFLPELQYFAFSKPLSQIRPVFADQVEPSIIKKLTQSGCARAAILRVWIELVGNRQIGVFRATMSIKLTTGDTQPSTALKWSAK
jgi:hypothetical protein